MKKTWHDDDRFWKDWRPMMFTEERWTRAPAEADQLVKLLKLRPAARVLDLCCGPGRHSMELAQRGFRVTGVDRTKTYLNDARKLARKHKVDIEFLQADMRKFRRPRAFDAIINMFTAFGYFRKQADDARVAKNMAASLKPGGALLMELIGKERIAKIFTERTWQREPDGALVVEERWLEDNFGWIENRWSIIRKGRTRTYRVAHRLYSAVELIALLKSCGFRRARAFGSLEGAPYDQNAQRLVIVARK
jgi:SAM-dependent methyltransferase